MKQVCLGIQLLFAATLLIVAGADTESATTTAECVVDPTAGTECAAPASVKDTNMSAPMDAADDDDDEEEDDDDENVDEKAWNEFSKEERLELWYQGITELMWDRSDDQDPYVTAGGWDELPEEFQEALEVLGWTESSYKFSDIPATSRLKWNELNQEQQAAASVLGYQATDWFLMSMKFNDEFEPLKLKLDIPEMQKFGFDYLKTLTDVEVGVANGATIGDDMYLVPERYTVASYVEEALKGTTLYLKFEDYDQFKKNLPSEIGESVNKYIGGALKESKEMRDKGHWQKSFDNKVFSDYNWSIWVGGRNTSTAMHYDIDLMNFLWVLEGKKRVILIPNDERNIGTYSCSAKADGNACWPEVDVLYTEELPEYAQEFILGPGEGISIPELSWHAVQNLEPTVAFGFRITSGFWDQPWSTLTKEEKEIAKAAGFTKSSWSKLLDLGRDAGDSEEDISDYDYRDDEADNDDDDDRDDEDDGDDEETMEETSEEYSDLAWEDLPADYRRQMQMIGYTKNLWERETSYLDKTLEEMTSDEKNALLTLSCSQADSVFPCFGLTWEDLSDKQKQAAKVLGYTKQDWVQVHVLQASA